MKNHLFFLVPASLLFLSACGFHPLHGPKSPPNTALVQNSQPAHVYIAVIPDREGQILRNELIDRLGQERDAPYRLEVSKIQESDKELAVTKSSEATRAQLRLKARMILKDRKGAELLVRDLQSVASYNVLASEFATRVTENSARENALQDLARQIDLQLRLFMK